MTQRNFNRLRSAIDKRNAHWLEACEPDIDTALRAEIEDGATPDEVESFVNSVAGEQEWFAKKVKGAARHWDKVRREKV